VFAAAERGETRLVLSSIVIAELYYANRKFDLFAEFSSVFRRLQQAPHFRLVGFEADQVLDFMENEGVPEMHDRIIAGLARRLEAPLLTSDARIADAGVAKIVW
jgi:predicted nucleic acid-binding protein